MFRVYHPYKCTWKGMTFYAVQRFRLSYSDWRPTFRKILPIHKSVGRRNMSHEVSWTDREFEKFLPLIEVWFHVSISHRVSLFHIFTLSPVGIPTVSGWNSSCINIEIFIKSCSIYVHKPFSVLIYFGLSVCLLSWQGQEARSEPHGAIQPDDVEVSCPWSRPPCKKAGGSWS